jgi:hypothetical protein
MLRNISIKKRRKKSIFAEKHFFERRVKAMLQGTMLTVKSTPKELAQLHKDLVALRNQAVVIRTRRQNIKKVVKV